MRGFRAVEKGCATLRSWSSRSAYFCDDANTDRTSPPDLGPTGAAPGPEDPPRGSVLAHGDVQNRSAADPAGGGDRGGRDVHHGAELDGGGHQETRQHGGQSGKGDADQRADAGEVRKPGWARAGEESELGDVGGC